MQKARHYEGLLTIYHYFLSMNQSISCFLVTLYKPPGFSKLHSLNSPLVSSPITTGTSPFAVFKEPQSPSDGSPWRRKSELAYFYRTKLYKIGYANNIKNDQTTICSFLMLLFHLLIFFVNLVYLRKTLHIFHNRLNTEKH